MWKRGSEGRQNADIPEVPAARRYSTLFCTSSSSIPLKRARRWRGLSFLALQPAYSSVSPVVLSVMTLRFGNHANFGQPGNVVGTRSFERIASMRFSTGEPGSSRQNQFVVKVIF